MLVDKGEDCKMKTKDLIKLLMTMPEDTEVLLSSDSEGNNISPIMESYSTGNFESKDESFYGCDGKEGEYIILYPRL